MAINGDPTVNNDPAVDGASAIGGLLLTMMIAVGDGC